MRTLLHRRPRRNPEDLLTAVNQAAPLTLDDLAKSDKNMIPVLYARPDDSRVGDLTVIRIALLLRSIPSLVSEGTITHENINTLMNFVPGADAPEVSSARDVLVRSAQAALRISGEQYPNIYILTHDANRRPFPGVVRASVGYGLLKRALVAQALWHLGFKQDPLLSTRPGVRSFLAEDLLVPRNDDNSDVRTLKTRRQQLLSSVVNRSVPEFGPQIDSAVYGGGGDSEKLKNAINEVNQEYGKLNNTWKTLFGNMTQPQKTRLEDMKTSISAYSKAHTSYLERMSFLRRQYADVWADVQAAMAEQDAERLDAATAPDRDPSSFTTQSERAVQLNEAAKSVMYSTGRPVISPVAMNEANRATYILATQQLKAARPGGGSGTRSLGQRISPASRRIEASGISPSTAHSQRSTYNSRVNIISPPWWLNSRDLDSSTVFRLSKDLSYAMIYRNGSSVAQYALGDYVPGTKATEVRSMISSMLDAEALWRSDSRHAQRRGAMPLYLSQDGVGTFATLYNPKKRGVLASFDPARILSLFDVVAEAGDDGFELDSTVEMKDIQRSMGATPMAMDESANDLMEKLYQRGLISRPEVEPEFTFASDQPLGGEGATEAPVADFMVRVFIPEYEQDYAKDLTAITDALVEASFISNINVDTAISPRTWSNLDPTTESLRPDQRLPAFLIRSARKADRPITLSSSGSGEEQVDKVTIRGPASVKGAPVVYFPLAYSAQGSNNNNKGLAEAIKAALRNGGRLYVGLADATLGKRVKLPAACDLISKEIVGRASIKPNERYNPNVLSILQGAASPVLGQAFAASVLESDFLVESDTGTTTALPVAKGLTKSILRFLADRGTQETMDYTKQSLDAILQQMEADAAGPKSNPRGRPRRNDGRQRRIEYVARAFQRITS